MVNNEALDFSSSGQVNPWDILQPCESLAYNELTIILIEKHMVGHPQKPAFKELLKKYKHYITATEKVLKNGTLSIMQYI